MTSSAPLHITAEEANTYDPADDGARCYELAIATKRAGLLKSREGQPLTIELPWPARALHPNARVHWSVKAKATKAARRDAAWAGMAAGIRSIKADALRVTAIFHPPDNRRRDADNMLASLKPSFDGIADVCGVDDSRWEIAIKRGEAVKDGKVVVEIEVLLPSCGQR